MMDDYIYNTWQKVCNILHTQHVSAQSAVDDSM